MFGYPPKASTTAVGAFLVLGLAACDVDDGPLSVADDSPSQNVVPENAEVSQQLAAVRELTAPFHQLEEAMEAGWSEQITPCLEHPTDGAMGFHYANPMLVDGDVDVMEPEVLVYAPWRDGERRLVALEYIVPLDAWEGEEPPELLGQHFHRNEEAGIWALHLWLWQHNPEGLHADWNPRISCAGSP